MGLVVVCCGLIVCLFYVLVLYVGWVVRLILVVGGHSLWLICYLCWLFCGVMCVFGVYGAIAVLGLVSQFVFGMVIWFFLLGFGVLGFWFADFSVG